MANLSLIQLSPLYTTKLITTTHTHTYACLKLPARDIKIDFGKHRGKMLGTLPSSYLQWVSNNLRARDFEHWAKLADVVLSDPVYRDRIEWEFAENILTGTSSYRGDSVSELLEISERFGWDNEDKKGWKNVDFGLLGTSKGGRIPRLSGDKVCEKRNVEKRVEVESCGEKRNVEKRVEVESCGEKRRERRDRVKKRRESTSFEMGEVREDMVRRSPFPGREGLLKKVLNRERLI